MDSSDESTLNFSMNNSIYELIKSVGCFTCGYNLKNFSITGDDYDKFLHGEIYNSIKLISDIICFWSPPDEIKHNKIFKKASNNFYAVKSSEIPIDFPLHKYINLGHGKRGSIAFHICQSRWTNLVSVISTSNSFGVPSSKTSIINDHSLSSWKWARNVSNSGDFAVMVDRQSGPENIDVFMPVGSEVHFVNECILERKEKSVYSSLWPTELF